MWLKKGIANGILLQSNITREELAKEFDTPLNELNSILDGEVFASKSIEKLFYSAFGSEVLKYAIDWQKTLGGS